MHLGLKTGPLCPLSLLQADLNTAICQKCMDSLLNFCTVVPPYLQVLCSSTCRSYLKLRIIPNNIYKTWYSCNIHKYGKV